MLTCSVEYRNTNKKMYGEVLIQEHYFRISIIIGQWFLTKVKLTEL